MDNKKTMAKGLAFGIVLSNIPTNYIANAIDEYKIITREKVELNNFKEEKIEKATQNSDVVKINKNIVEDSVLEITLTDGEYVPDLTGNPDGYETIKISTTNGKKLVNQDYVNLKKSGIPNIDLSSAISNSIPKEAFEDSKHLISFKFPQGVTTIESHAFYGCSGLTGSLLIPDTVTSINTMAFDYCSGLTGDLIIPNAVTSIGNSAFYGCSGFTGNLVIPNSVTSIGSSAFSGCSGLTGDLIIPNAVTSIGSDTFQDCKGFTGNLVIPDSVANIGNSAFYGCSGFTGNLMISDSVKIIDNWAFSGCSGLTGDLIIPDSVTNIGSYAFRSCNGFTGDLIIPDSIANIGNSAFENCKGFTGDLVIPGSVTSIGDSAFENCKGFTGDLVIPDSVISIGKYAFKDCEGFSGNLVISNSVTTIGYATFYGCSGFTGDLIIPDSVTNIGNSAFGICYGFKGNLVIPNSVTSIGNSAFEGCNGFTGDLIIPDSVTSIGSSAFRGCRGFTGNLVIPDSVTSIGSSTFSVCDKIEKIFIKVNSSDSSTDYKKDIISQLSDISQTIIDLPYDFDINGTWLETTNKTIGKPIIKNVIDGIESELVDYKGEVISLYIPSLHKESNITVLKDGRPFELPIKNSDAKYIFNKQGVYQVTITTDLGNTSVIDFQVEDPQFKNAEEAVNKAENSNDIVDVEMARDLVNKLPESTIKDQLQNRLNEISPDLYIESKTTTSNVDIYIKSENMLSMTLNTNSIMFEDFSGIKDMEKQNAIELTINSSLPYQLNAYLPTEIQNADKSTTMDKSILNIKENSKVDYQTFTNTTDKIVLKDNCNAGNDLVHRVDLMLKGGIAHEKDVYKTTIKFEAEQK